MEKEHVITKEIELNQFNMNEKTIISQAKFDGMRLIIHKQGDKIKIFTEDAKRDRAHILPQVVKEVQSLKEDVILDTEMVVWENGKPIRREAMMFLIVGKEPMSDDVDLHVNIHDVLYYKEAINLKPYHERLAALDEILPKDLKYLKKAKSCVITDRKSFDKCLKEAYDYPGSEGAMGKRATSVYDPNDPRTDDWIKIKKVKEIDCQIIGIQRKALPFSSIDMKAPTENVTGKEAEALYKKLTKESNTYIFRCALKDGKELIPIDAKKQLSPSDFEIKWNADLSNPKWVGLDDPSLWETDKDFPARKPGEVAYGNTYAFGVAPKPKIGDVITVVPVQLAEFEKDGKKKLSWMFPRVRERKPEGAPDNIDDIGHLIDKI